MESVFFGALRTPSSARFFSAAFIHDTSFMPLKSYSCLSKGSPRVSYACNICASFQDVRRARKERRIFVLKYTLPCKALDCLT